MRLHGLDLNLLVALDALLQARSVTLAAEAVHVSQPTLSGSLGRLREHFNDPLLVPAGRGMMLSPLGELLRQPVRDTIRQIERTISLRPAFDPRRDDRHFTLCASDFSILVLGAPLLRVLQRLAPGVTVQWTKMSPTRIGDALVQGDLDLALVAEPFVDPVHPSLKVLEDRYVCVTWTGNRLLADGLTAARYAELGHVGTRYGHQSLPGALQTAVDALQLPRRLEVVCDSPALVASLVVGTQRIGTLGERLAMRLAKQLPLRVWEHPWPLPPLRIVMQWNRLREGDGAVDWLRAQIERMSRRLLHQHRITLETA